MENKLKEIENNPPQKVSERSREEFNNLKNTVDTLTSIWNTLTQVTNTLTNVIANRTSLKDNYNRAVYLYNLEDFEIEYPSVKIKRKI